MRDIDISRIILKCLENDGYNVAIMLRNSKYEELRNYVKRIEEIVFKLQLEDLCHFNKPNSQFLFVNKSRIMFINVGTSLINFSKLDGVQCDKIVLIKNKEFEEDLIAFLKSRIRAEKIHCEYSTYENETDLILTKCE